MFWLLFKSTPYFPLYTKSLMTPPDCCSVELINANKSLLMYIVYVHGHTYTHTHTHTCTPTHTCTYTHTHTPTHMHTGGWTLCQIHPGKVNCMSHTHTHPHTHTYTHHTGDWKLNQIHSGKQFVELHVPHTPTHTPTHTCTHTHTHTPTHITQETGN